MPSLRKGIVGSLLLISGSLLNKMVGLISTLILARVLLPEDFGLIAIATLIMGFIEVFSQLGSSEYIVKEERISNETLNTVFTLAVVTRSLLTMVLVLSAPLVADYYEDIRLEALIYVFGLSFFLDGLGNPAQHILRREQLYSKLVFVNVTAKVSAVILSVAVALIYESYWALALGTLTSKIITLIGGYLIFPYIPKFSLLGVRKQWAFSGWLIPQGLIGFFRNQIDTFIVNSTFSTTDIGGYNTSKYLAFIPSSDVILPGTEPLLAQLASIKSNKNYFTTKLNLSILISLVIAIPISLSLYFQSDFVINLLLGEQWRPYANIFGCFALCIPSFCLFVASRRLFVLFANTKHFFYFEFLFLIFLSLTYFFLDLSSLAEFVIIKVALDTMFSFLIMIYALVLYTSPFNALKMGFTILVISIGSVALFYTLDSVWRELVGSDALYFDFIYLALINVLFILTCITLSKYLSSRNAEAAEIHSTILRITNNVKERF